MLRQILLFFFGVPKQKGLIRLIAESVIIFFFIRIFIFDIGTCTHKDANVEAHTQEKFILLKLGYNINNNSIPYFGFDLGKFHVPSIYDYKINDVVLYFDEKDATYITSKIIATAGDVIQIKNHDLVINGDKYETDLIITLDNIEEFTVPENSYISLHETDEDAFFKIIKDDSIIGLCSLYILPTVQDFDSILDIISCLPDSIQWSKIFSFVK